MAQKCWKVKGSVHGGRTRIASRESAFHRRLEPAWRDIVVSNFINNTVQIGGAVHIVERYRRACFPDENATKGESYQSSGFLGL